VFDQPCGNLQRPSRGTSRFFKDFPKVLKCHSCSWTQAGSDTLTWSPRDKSRRDARK
jgi:hypothetical protein